MHLIAAFRAFFRVLSSGDAAPASTAALPPAPPPPATAFQASSAPAVQVLALLQQEGRLVDLIMEDISKINDADLGAAVRPMHAGCRNVIVDRFAPEPICAEAEGANAQVAPGFDASAIRLEGNVGGAGPWNGRVRHRGWRATKAQLPTVAPGADANVIAPAEIDV